MSGGQQPGTNEGQASLQAGTEAVELKTLPVTESSSIPGGPVPDPDAISPAGPSVSTAPHVAPITIPDSGLAVPPAPPSPKGKEKEEPQRSSLAIEPSDDLPPASPVASGDAAVCIITLLLATGARHPYRLDEKYLTKRGVEVPGMTEAGRKDPFSVSVYTLKELILREWRDEWEVKPSSPTSIRLIYFGKLLDDKMQLKGMCILCHYVSGIYVSCGR